MMNTPEKTVHTISMLVANKPGVLGRIALVFARRGFNIDSLVVSPTENGDFSSMTVTSTGNYETLDQIIKQVAKLVDIIHVQEHSENEIVREIALIKVSTKKENLAELLMMVDHFNASTEDFTDDSLIIRVAGSSDKLDSLIKMLRQHGIIEVVRSGKILMTRGKNIT